jgi:hypothetical protein
MEIGEKGRGKRGKKCIVIRLWEEILVKGRTKGMPGSHSHVIGQYFLK